MRVSVITNTYNRSPELVERSLLASLHLTPAIHELIFIDQNPQPINLSQEIVSDHRFRCIKTSSKCVSEARNQAPIDTDADWIVFCDDDGYFAPDYMEILTQESIRTPEIQLFAGSIIRDDNGEYYSPRHKIGGNLMTFKSTKLLMGSNFAVRPHTFISLGKFDSLFGAGSYWGSGEETDFAWKAYFKNTPMRYERNLRVFHVKPYADKWTKSISKAFRYGRGKGALVTKWLFKKKKGVVAYELAEMYAVPTIQIIRSALFLRWKSIPIFISSLAGRTWGVIAYLFKREL